MFLNRYNLVSDFSDKTHYWDTEKDKSVCGTRIDGPFGPEGSKPTCKRCVKWLAKKKT